jgi:hypothetical protein
MAASDYRLPDGAKLVSADDAKVVVHVEIPIDEEGFFGRQCPSCEQTFRMAHADYEALPDDVRLWCVYCGHEDDHSEFLTEQQRQRVLRPAHDIAHQLIEHAFNDTFSGMDRRSRESMISWSYRSTPYYPEPLPDIDEERLVRERSCAVCSVRYAVFGEHRYCPVCGPLPPAVIAEDALNAEQARLDALATLPVETAATLREQGVFDRIYADTVENLVSIVEILADAKFRAVVVDADAVLKGRGKVFQRLDDMARLFRDDAHMDLKVTVGDRTWAALKASWAARHVFTHNDGIVDAKYLSAVPQATVKVGQRLTLTERTVRDAIAVTTSLCKATAGADMPPAS